MDAKATQEFLAELKVLTHVHHLNLVGDHLIFFCDRTTFETNLCYLPTILFFLYFPQRINNKID